MKKKTALKIAKELSELFPDEDFSSNGYVGATEKIAFTCKIHGVQQGLVDNIKKRTGTACTSCIRHQNKASKLHEAVSKLKTRFSDMDFSRFNPALLNAKSTVVCPVHNEFQVSPDSMAANKYGCSKCGDAKTAEGKRLGFESFQIRALKAHSGMYTYKKADYIDTTTPMTIHCPAHKEFMQKPTNHLAGQGCPECGSTKRPHALLSFTTKFSEFIICRDCGLILAHALDDDDRECWAKVNKNYLPKSARSCFSLNRYRRLK